MLQSDFEGKNILIIGASSGIGKVTAEHLYKKGANLILVARNEDVLQEMTDSMPGRCIWYKYDLLDLENIKDIFTFCKDKGIKLDGMVFTAGVCELAPIKTMEISWAERVMKLNALSFLELGKYFAQKKYSNEASSIVGLSSYEALLFDKGQSVYAASKSALDAFAKVMAKEFVKRSIRVNTILPAMVDTPMLHNNQDGEVNYEAIRHTQALGVIEPMQIAYLVEFLLSDCSKYITGEGIAVNAGWIG